MSVRPQKNVLYVSVSLPKRRLLNTATWNTVTSGSQTEAAYELAERELCQGADFCNEMAGETDTTFNRVYMGNPPSRAILRTDDFYVLADLSPLTVGHMLLLPRQHYLSFADLIPAKLASTRAVLDWLTPLYRNTFGELTVLEHGSTLHADHSACITHAHWHLVPIDGNAIEQVAVADGLEPVYLDNIEALGRTPWVGTPYFLRSLGKGYHITLAINPQRRQYLRSVVGRILGMNDPEWDYAIVVRQQQLRETMTKVENWPSFDDGAESMWPHSQGK